MLTDLFPSQRLVYIQPDHPLLYISYYFYIAYYYCNEIFMSLLCIISHEVILYSDLKNDSSIWYF